MQSVVLQIREMAACGLQLVAPPEGFFSAAVVPYDPVSRQLDPDSAIDHLSNRYCGDNTRDGIDLNLAKINTTLEKHCTIQVDRFLLR